MTTKPARGTKSRLSFWAGPLMGCVVFAVCSGGGMGSKAAATAAITTLCAVWWVLEPIAIPATSVIPFALLPLFGIVDHAVVASAYGNPMILLLLGGFMLSVAMEQTRTHERLALIMVRLFGGSPRRVVLGFMVASAACSMWISNSATTLMLLPIALAVLRRADTSVATPLLLGIAYAASIGGVGTLVGTPPNLIFASIYQDRFADAQRFGFASWMMIGVPVVIVFLPLVWIWLARRIPASSTAIVIDKPGPWRKAEIRVLVIFTLTALAWIFLDQPAGGLRGLLTPRGATSTIGTETVALCATVALFVTPAGDGGRILDWSAARSVPWGLLLLFGGGLALAKAFDASGLSEALGGLLAGAASLPPLLLVLSVCLVVTFLTEVTSNTATTSLLMPILAAAAVAAGIDPALLMVPAALSASCAFMLPVATAPNAIVFGSEHVTTRDMMRNGFVLNLIGACVITAVCLLVL
ncbi:MAG: SLC13/DASS family transporter [Planctomycetes bacterium]|nr:SLC13/DASS family transporter [Planctomycetota bacterium]